MRSTEKQERDAQERSLLGSRLLRGFITLNALAIFIIKLMGSF
jgi:hypothetical protein